MAYSELLAKTFLKRSLKRKNKIMVQELIMMLSQKEKKNHINDVKEGSTTG